MAFSPAETAAPELCVVVPVHNEEGNVAPLVGEITAALRGRLAFEMIYVDDGSKDQTLPRLLDLAKENPELRVLRHVNRCGQSAAIWTGVKHAGAPLIATLDGDGQNDPADIPALVARHEKEGGGDKIMIAGHREKRRDSKVKLMSSRIANKIRRGLLNDDLPDTGCGLKVFTREAFLTFPRFDHMHRYLAALMIRHGGKTYSVRVNHRPRERGVSKYGVWNRLWVGVADLFGVMWLQARGSRPTVEEAAPPSRDGRDGGAR